MWLVCVVVLGRQNTLAAAHVEDIVHLRRDGHTAGADPLHAQGWLDLALSHCQPNRAIYIQQQ